MSNKLDNPVWYSLAEAHKDFAIDYDDFKFYQPDHCPFGGFINVEKTLEAIDAYSKLTDDFYIVGDKPMRGSTVILQKELLCDQMILETAIDIKIQEEIIIEDDNEVEVEEVEDVICIFIKFIS